MILVLDRENLVLEKLGSHVRWFLGRSELQKWDIMIMVYEGGSYFSTLGLCDKSTAAWGHKINDSRTEIMPTFVI